MCSSDLNRSCFFQSPFSFIDYIHSFNPNQRCLVPLPFDEFHFDNRKVSFQRPLGLDVQTLMDMYAQYRTFVPEERVSGLPDRVDGFHSSGDLESIRFDFTSYYQANQAEFFRQLEVCEGGYKQTVAELFRSKGICWSLQTEEGHRIAEIDFTQNPAQLVEGASRANCGLIIKEKDLIALLESKELLSILTQSCSISTWGETKDRAYHALNVLWYAGFEDVQRLRDYIRYCAGEVA